MEILHDFLNLFLELLGALLVLIVLIPIMLLIAVINFLDNDKKKK